MTFNSTGKIEENSQQDRRGAVCQRGLSVYHRDLCRCIPLSRWRWRETANCARSCLLHRRLLCVYKHWSAGNCVQIKKVSSVWVAE